MKFSYLFTVLLSAFIVICGESPAHASAFASVDSNINEVGGNTTSVNNGTADSGTLRVTVASDSSGNVGLNAGTNTVGSVRTKSSATHTYVVMTSQNTPAASTTDMFTLYGSGTATVKVLKVEMLYTGTTSALSTWHLVKRSTADSGGTANTETKIAANSNDPSAVASVKSYTANPSGLGTSVGDIASGIAYPEAPGTPQSIGQPSTVYNQGATTASLYTLYHCDDNEEPITLNSASEGLCINFGGTSPVDKVAARWTWTEE